MLPRWHIILGALFTLLLWFVAPNIGWVNLLLVFFASFLIDFDHYAASVMKSGKIGLFHSFEYHKKLNAQGDKEKARGIKIKGDFHLFHTLEFHLLVALLGIFWTPFFYIFVGMVFHSLLDIISMMYMGVMYRREFFFFNWVRRKI